LTVSNINSNLVNNIIESTKKTEETSSFEEKLKLAYDEKDKEKLKESCQEFEAVFLNIVFKEMKDTVPQSQLVEQSNAREIFQSMLDDEMMNKVSKGYGIGISDQLYDAMSKKIDNLYEKDI
jgi:flagellar protein FlgJ